MAISIAEVQAAVDGLNVKLDTVLTTVDTETTQAATYREEQKAALAALQAKLDEVLAGGVVDPADIQRLFDSVNEAGVKVDKSIANIQAIQE